MKKAITLCFLLSQLIINAQDINNNINSCGSDAVLQKLLKDNPEMATKMAAFESALKSHSLTAKSAAPTIYRIPVVFHVMHKGEAIGVGSNLSDDAIKTKLRYVNEQFRKIPGSTGDGAGVDMGIEYVLAVVDPQGNPTNGIVRYNMTGQTAYMNNGVNSSGTTGISEANLKALSFWDSNLYYNIWTVYEIDNNEGGNGIQGQTQPPSAHGTALDGLFVLSKVVKDPLDRTLTHELGHSLFLYHTFQGDNPSGDGVTLVCPSSDPTQGDLVADTAPHKRATSGDCSVTTNACYPSNTDLSYLHNYMNYTLDGCRNMFTAGQQSRAASAFSFYCGSFLTSASTAKLVPVAAPVAGFQPTQPIVVTTGSSVELSDASTGVPSNYLNYYNWPGMSFNWTVTDGATTMQSTDQNPTFNFTSEGVYDVSHDVNNGVGSSTIKGNQVIYAVAPATELPASTLTSTSSGNCGNNYVKLNTLEKTIVPTANTTYVDYINTDNTVLLSGITYPLAINTKASSSYTEYLSIYIDWNNDGTFNETNEKLGATSIGAGTAIPRTVDLPVPTNCVKNKLLRMRVSGNARDAISNNMINGKAPFFIGDTKDFGLYIVDKAPVLGTADYTLTELNFYPNPVKDIFNISNSDNIDRVEIYNILGQMVMTQSFQNANVQMNLSNLVRGTYIATIYSNGKKGTIKVLKN